MNVTQNYFQNVLFYYQYLRRYQCNTDYKIDPREIEQKQDYLSTEIENKRLVYLYTYLRRYTPSNNSFKLLKTLCKDRKKN